MCYCLCNSTYFLIFIQLIRAEIPVLEKQFEYDLN